MFVDIVQHGEGVDIPQIMDYLKIDSTRVKQILLSLLVRPSKSCRSGLVMKMKRDGVPPLPLLNDDEFCLHPNFKNTKMAFTLRRPQSKGKDSKSLGTWNSSWSWSVEFECEAREFF